MLDLPTSPPRPSTDPEGFEMHFNVGTDEAPEWRSYRGTSIIECWHSKYHHLFEGYNLSPETFVFVSNMAVIDWNNGINVRCYGKTDYGLLHQPLLRRNNTLYKLLGQPAKYKDAALMYAAGSPELFHFDWRKLTGTCRCRVASPRLLIKGNLMRNI